MQSLDRPIHLDTKSRLTRLESWPSLYPEEVVTLVLFALTIAVNVAVHHTLNIEILFRTANTYRVIFEDLVRDFFRALKYCVIAYLSWQFVRFIAGWPVHLVAWQRTGKFGMAMRAFLVYTLCNVAFLNLEGFIHRISPIDRDSYLMAIDRALFLGHEPLKLLDPLVSYQAVEFFLQVYLTLYLVPLIAIIGFLHQGKLRAFRDTTVSLVLAVSIGWLGYILVPAIGPQYTLRYTFVRPVLDVQRMLAYGTDNLARDVFPSLHTGLSVTVLIIVWRYSTNWFYRVAFTVWVVGIVFSTMYLRFHYVIDVLAGIGLAVLVTYLGRRINDWWYAGNPEREGQGAC
jgi:membrane-associated phospholipid phosphatase